MTGDLRLIAEVLVVEKSLIIKVKEEFSNRHVTLTMAPWQWKEGEVYYEGTIPRERDLAALIHLSDHSCDRKYSSLSLDVRLRISSA